jgi:hypothetical protein
VRFENKNIFFKCEKRSRLNTTPALCVGSCVVVVVRLTPGPNPTTSIYNASVVNFYNATGSLARYES